MTLLLFLLIIIIVLIYCYNKVDVLSENFSQTDDIKNAINKTYNLNLQPIKDLIDLTDLYPGNKLNFANTAKLPPNKILNISGSLHTVTNVTANNLNISNIRAMNNVNTTSLITKDLSGQDLTADDISGNHLNMTSDPSKILSTIYTNDITFKNGKKLSSYEDDINNIYNKITKTSLDNISSTDATSSIYQDASDKLYIDNLAGKNITTENVTSNQINSNIINSNITDINNYKFYKKKDALVIGETSNNDKNIVYPGLILNPANNNNAYLISNIVDEKVDGYNFSYLSNQFQNIDDIVVSKYKMINNKYNTKGMPIYDTLDEYGKYATTTLAPNQIIPA